MCNFCHCWISSTSSNYILQFKILIKKVFNIWSTKLLLYASVHYYLKDLQRITVLQSFVYIFVFWKPHAIRFSNWMFTIEFEGITMNGTVLIDETRRFSQSETAIGIYINPSYTYFVKKKEAVQLSIDNFYCKSLCFHCIWFMWSSSK